MQVHVGRVKIGMSKELLNTKNICAGFQRMGGETMAQGMNGAGCCDIGTGQISAEEVFNLSGA